MGAGLISSSYLIFSGNESELYCLQECGQGKARLTEGESFKCEGVFHNFTLKHRLVLLSKGLKEIRSSNSSLKNTGKK